MDLRSDSVRRTGWATGGLAIAAAVATVLAPTAAASGFYGLNVDNGSEIITGTTLTVGTKYRISAVPFDLGSGHTHVVFFDNGQCVGTGTYFPVRVTVGASVEGVTWVPTSAGVHTLTAQENGDTLTLQVNVAAAPAGSPVATQPAQGGCGGGGSIGSGSAGSGSSQGTVT